MVYEHIAPSNGLEGIVQSFWVVDSEGDSQIDRQKIVPDGYPEVIYHYGDPFRINISGQWYSQEKKLLAGQIKNHFYLENTGVSGMVGIKFKPLALANLFGINMASITDRVVPLEDYIPDLSSISLNSFHEKDAFIGTLENILLKRHQGTSYYTEIESAIENIIESKGNVKVSTLAELSNMSERKLERLFLKQIGLSPKFYARIIRLTSIFKLMQAEDQTWSDLVFQAGFYDQSHFIKNFQEFTGEDPSAYGFNDQTMANFHMNK
ncbi:helix-turn-helix transcriptional regulator [Roseivirga misakiensis]|uniref:HTH araC/xylS-type domain-containing protein n=1 Tax=Roseivirga misakiensis TaxID=1563681 RepID=A0A1E5T044_9BACT|nr:helix-turn-helix transcriptional regulator [Roseivirga misakiensis]OEK04729.1 hypothetical protein BFP71_14880 [Roseivirga misakiensis]